MLQDNNFLITSFHFTGAVRIKALFSGRNGKITPPVRTGGPYRGREAFFATVSRIETASAEGRGEEEFGEGIRGAALPLAHPGTFVSTPPRTSCRRSNLPMFLFGLNEKCQSREGPTLANLRLSYKTDCL